MIVNTMMKNKNISGQTGQSYRAMLSDASLNRSIVWLAQSTALEKSF